LWFCDKFEGDCLEEGGAFAEYLAKLAQGMHASKTLTLGKAVQLALLYAQVKEGPSGMSMERKKYSLSKLEA